MTLLFVHGTGVRFQSLKETMKVVKEGAKSIDPNGDVRECQWSDVAGIPNFEGLSLPDPPKPKPLDPVIELQWELLAADPLFELRLWCTPATGKKQAGLGRPEGVALWEDKISPYAPSSDVLGRLKSAGGADEFARSWKALVSTGVPEKAFRVALNADVKQVSRSFAEAVIARFAIETGGLHPDRRIEAVEWLMRDWGQEFKAIPEMFVKLLGRAEKKWLRPARASLSELIAPAIGDLLRYQAVRGDAHKEIRRRIVEVSDEAKEDIVVVAHSLGGIACVELLWAEKLPVRALITAGS